MRCASAYFTFWKIPTSSIRTSKPRRLKKSRPLRPDEPQLHRFSATRRADEAARRLDDVGVETAAQPFVGGDDNQQDLRFGRRLALGEKWMRRRIDAARHAVEHALHMQRERPRAHDPLLRATQLRGGDHLHRLRDLLRRFHRPDAAAEVKQ